MNRVLFLALIASLYPGSSDAQGCSLQEVPPFGLYTDKPSYAPGEPIDVHASWDTSSGPLCIEYRLLEIRQRGVASWPSRASSGTLEHAMGPNHVTPFGSYVDLPDHQLSGLNALTLCGFVRPTYVEPDGGGTPEEGSVYTVLAGQLDTGGATLAGPGGIGIDRQGHLFATVRTGTGVLTAVDPTPMEASRWSFVAATLQKKNVGSAGPGGVPGLGGQHTLRLYRADFDPTTGTWECVSERDKDQRMGTSPVISSGLPMLLGASTVGGEVVAGLDGRLDRWELWSRRLSKAQLQSKLLDGVGPAETIPTCTSASPPANGLKLSLAFEDPYGTTLVNAGGTLGDGELMGHGTPGVAGRPPAERALRLNRDQVVDAQFPVLHTFDGTVTAGLAPGYYALQAVFHEYPCGTPCTPVPCDQTAENLGTASRFQSFVVRPPTGATADVAVIVPTSTWTAYNPWPGVMGREVGVGTAAGIPTRPGCASQGNNAAYARMGDGASAAHYFGWRRPNLRASPIETESVLTGILPIGWSPNRRDAALDSLVFEWLEAPTGGELSGPLSYHAYTDLDLDAHGRVLAGGSALAGYGIEDLNDYKVVMFIGHQEYWSEPMLDGAIDYAQSGGNLVCVGGNTIVWRAENALTDSGNPIVEVKKWPTEVEFLGNADSESLLAGGRTGSWRFIEQCASGTAGARDVLLGTLGDVGGGMCFGSPASFGFWKVDAPTHWLWEGSVIADEKVTDTGRVVGNEVDAYIDPALYPTSILPNVEVAHAVPGSLAVLASGTDFCPANCVPPAIGCSFGYIDWAHSAFAAVTCDALHEISLGDIALNSAGASAGPHGSIVYYRHQNGGRVLNVAAIDSPSALWAIPTSGVNRISAVVERALRCMIQGGDDCKD
ncbi:MAG: N,N-dimethylformamidase beta subunit family domain-containing protein [Planctomycetota bacterium]